ncbi:MAG: LysR family transcriptional regulator [Alphaproteobacteria bacterium]|nr:LysR family transcriptional regulator [Alphaproteobacteria bacterium]
MGENRLRWDDIEIFCLLAEFGSIRQAASQCGQSIETVRRRINALEVALGERLFRRTAQGLAITQAGEEILGEARRARDAVRSISRIAGAEPSWTRRTIRLSVPEDIGALWLASELCLSLGDSTGLTTEWDFHLPGGEPDWAQTDIALQFQRPSAPELICRKIGALNYGLFTRRTCHDAFKFADQNGLIADVPLILPEDRHPYVAALAASESWTDVSTRPAMRLDSAFCRFSILKTTNVATVLPAIEAAMFPDILRLPEHIAPSLTVDLWAVFHDDIRRNKGTREVLDLLFALISRNPELSMRAQPFVSEYAGQLQNS